MGSDSRWGRRLPAALAGAGLTGVRMISTQVMAGDGGPGDDFWRVTLAQTAPQFLRRGLATAAELEELVRLFDDPAFLDISFAVTSAWGRRAPA
ncbi:hypothetical protein [Nonomuraea sp. LPB2021202275-12-8]|uniref:hypothetical protein n=1 Tax=Nonomuraea sp. LPB2021202275-12-8 TaxID=3120159 RepID=UPI00300C224B